jgi:hypothetical protein
MLALKCSSTGTFDSLPLRKLATSVPAANEMLEEIGAAFAGGIPTPDRFIELPLSEAVAVYRKVNADSSEKIVLTP